MGERLNILSLCDYTGNMLKPWADSGAYCMAVDNAIYNANRNQHKILEI